ncbi:MAG: HPr family phosphocarrier protein [Caulobacterales bacterium]|nr:HPr family phosphocarrier protein [Caulobacterales bacterium]
MVLRNRRGLHARASAKFVEMAERYDATVTVTKDGETVCADSIMELLMLAAGPGTALSVAADGPEADEALAALDALVANQFGEGE